MSGLRRSSLAAAATLVLAAACSSDGGLELTAPPRAEPTLEARACEKLEEGFTVTCLALVVPENRADPDGAIVRLAVTVLHSRALNPAPDPIVQIAGGPGGSGLEQVGFWEQSPLLDQRDMVLFDQRGAGASQPSLDCPERNTALARDLGQAEPYEVEVDLYRDALSECRRRLGAAGVDLDQYDTVAAAADLADLREALGVAEWNLYGISYGTRVALEAMRSHPEGIRSVVLDSAYPPGVGSLADVHGRAGDAFDRYFAACASDPVCSSTYPGLEQLLDAVVERYNATPFTGTADLGPVGAGTIVITGDDLRAALYNMLANTALNPQLPAIVSRLANGDVADIPGLVAQGVPRTSALSEGVQLGAECADNGEFDGPGRDLVDDPGASSAFIVHLAAPYCSLWDVEPLPAGFHRTVRSPIPTLVVAGSFDPVTPAADSAATARSLERAAYVELAGAGHGVSFDSPCVAALAAAFVADPEPEALDASCAANHAPTFT